MGSPWKIVGQQIIMTNWVPKFDPTKAHIAELPLWVMLPGLPLEYWDPVDLHAIVAPIGTILRMDEVTQSKGRANNKAMFARALVELDLDKEPIEGVCIRSLEGERF
ncbi:hypothetical protein AAC387_Pa02g0650 [Persea americana]